MRKGRGYKSAKKALSVILATSMVASLFLNVSSNSTVWAKEGSSLVPRTEADGDVTFFYQGNGSESEVYVKGSWVSDWSKYYYMTEDTDTHVWSVTADLAADTDYEYGIVADDNWVGDPQNPWAGSNSKIVRNPKVSTDSTATFYYYPAAGESDVVLNYKLVDSENSYTTVSFTKDATASAILSASTEVLNGTYEYFLTVEGKKVTDYNAASNIFTVKSIPQADPSVVSPVVKDNEVTFSYYAPLAKEVYVAGNMNDWNASADLMEYNEKTGYWTKTLTLNKGTYQYKFVVDGNWEADPLNNKTDWGNSVVEVTSKLETAVESPVIEGKKVTFQYQNKDAKEVLLAGSMTDWQSGAKAMVKDEETGIFSLTLTLENGDYAYKFIVDGNWINDPVNTDIADGNNVFTVAAADTFLYKIYYYKEGLTKAEDAALWLWNYGVGAGSEYYFDDVEVIDGNTWLVANIDLDYTALGVIPKSKGSWSWQEADHVFQNTEENAVSTIYLVAEDEKVYTEVPDLTKKAPTRVVFVEYERPASDYEGWNIYTWDNGYSNTDYEFKEINGKMVCEVPVKEGREGFSFCMRHSVGDNIWEAKDGGDHFAAIALDTQTVKARFVQDQGVVEYVADAKDYTLYPVEKAVVFQYRNDELFRAYEEEALSGKVAVLVDGEEFAMDYVEASELYEATWDALTAGTHTYQFVVDGEVLEEKTFEYKAFDALVEASVSIDEMSTRKNAVVSFEMTGETNGLEIASAVIDLTAIGGASDVCIDSKLQAVTIGVKDGTQEGAKELPITVTDTFGNVYETVATVTVVADNKDDFSFDESIIYFTVTDRFYNGNTANDDAYGLADNDGGSLSYHGGDFAGLTEKLDYIQSLGANTVWVTPIVENYCEGLTTDLAGVKSYGYHGYWASDFTKLNAHLGTEEEFAALVEELHKRGMKIMVDVVLNHAGYNTEDNFNSQLADKKMLRDETTTVKGDTKLDGLAGLPDFVTEDAQVRDLLIEWQTQWVKDYDIDYFRVDTVKHVDQTTWEAFKNALTILDPEFRMIGEYAGAGYANPFDSLGAHEMDSLLDFDFNDKAQSFVTGNISEVERYFEMRNGALSNTATMGQFTGSHDEDGLQYKLINQNGIAQEKAYDLMKAASALQITAKGQPVIYYGEELGQFGADNYPYQTNRYDFDWEKAANGSDMFDHYQKLLSIRNDYTKVFAKGTRSAVVSNDEEGYVVFERSYGKDSLYVGISIAETAKEVTLSMPELAGYKLNDLYSGKEFKVAADGSVVVTIPAVADGGTVVLVKNLKKEVQPWDQKTRKDVFIGEGFTVTYDLRTVWNNGYYAAVTLKNTGNTTITNWQLGFDYDGNDAYIINATVKSEKDNHVVVKNAGWNKTVKPGQSVTFYLNGTKRFAGFPVNYELVGQRRVVDSADYTVTYRVTNDWLLGFNGQIVITNKSDRDLEDWTLEFDYNRSLLFVWNAEASSKKSHYTFSSEDYNATIKPGQSVVIGFTGIGGNKASVPTNVSLTSY